MIKVGIVGCGNVVENYHFPCYALMKDVKIVAIADLDKKTLNRFGDKFSVKNRYEDMSTMLKQHELDFVDISTPVFTHYDLCLKAINSNVNVLIEKPLSLSAEQAYELKNRSSKRNLKVCVVQNFRFRDPFLKLRRLQEEGKIGRIESIYVGHHGLFIFANPPWLWNEEVSGGVLYDQGIHSLDILSWLMSKNQRIIGIDFHYEESIKMTTSVRAMVKDEKGCIGLFDFRWLAPSSFFHVNISSTVTDAFIKLYPDAIGLRQGDWGPLTEALSDVKRVLKFGMLFLKGEAKSLQPHFRIISSFVSSLKSDGRPPVTIDDVIPTLELLDEVKKNIKRSEHLTE